MAADDEGRREPSSSHHFLVVAYGVQSHVNPGRVLARRLAQLGGSAGVGPILATLSVPLGTYRRMFPGTAETTTTEPAHAHDGVISYVAHSDGLDDGTVPADAEDMARRRRATAESLSAVVARLAARDHPVTCMVCTLVFPPVLDVARERGIPLAVFWIQSAAALAVHYHYFHDGYDEVVAASHAALSDEAVCVVPGLSLPLRIRDFPSFLVSSGSGSESAKAKALVEVFRELFEYMDQWRPKVLVNTLDELEASVLVEMKRHLVDDVFTVGPMVGSSTTEARIHLFEHGDVERTVYMEWLHAHPEKSVVYVSFGSVVKQRKQQMDEIIGGLRRCGRPYLLVMRRDGLLLEEEEDESSHSGGGLGESCSTQQGMVVDWCDQLEVLSHPAVGCFVTHCGWNSTLEAMASGVPVVGVPNMFDQPTNMFLVEEEWMVGVRGERDGDGALTATELERCIEIVMGEGARAKAMRERVEAVRERAKAAADAGGAAERNLRDFVNTFKVNG